MPTQTPTQVKHAAMVAEMEPFIRSLSVKFSRLCAGRVDAHELAQLGRFAVLVVAPTYDSKAGAKWTTFGYVAARNAMGNEIRKAGRAAVPLDGFNGTDDGDGDNRERLIDTLPATTVLPDVACETAEQNARVRAIVARVRAEATNVELFDAVLARLQAAVEISERYEGTTFRSEITLEEIAKASNCTRENVRLHEKRIKARLAAAFAELE